MKARRGKMPILARRLPRQLTADTVSLFVYKWLYPAMSFERNYRRVRLVVVAFPELVRNRATISRLSSIRMCCWVKTVDESIQHQPLAISRTQFESFFLVWHSLGPTYSRTPFSLQKLLTVNFLNYGSTIERCRIEGYKANQTSRPRNR